MLAGAQGDLGLVWIRQGPTLDMLVRNDDLLADRTPRTAVLLSLFTDQRVDGVAGWWADELLPQVGDRYGSKLWLLARAKRVPGVDLQAKQYAEDALAWMVTDGVVKSIAAETELTKQALLLGVTHTRPDDVPTSYKFQHVWNESGWSEVTGVI